MSCLVAPSVLSADFKNLEADIKLINKSMADWFHIDIMDGVFVPNISFGFPVVKAIKEVAEKPLDVHLMIVEPDRYIEKFAEVGSDILTVHYEACSHLHRTIQNIKSNGMKAGVSLNPHSSIDLLEDIISDLDLVLIMSVNPGFGGQKFIQNSFSKIERLKKMITDKKSKTMIEVDGGVDDTNAEALIKIGADVLVAGNYVFKSKNPLSAIEKLKSF